MPNNICHLKKQNHKNGFPTGADLLQDPFLNKGMAFSAKERTAFGLWGLLPPRILTLEQQAERFLSQLRNQSTDLEKYMSMISLQDRNRTLFYKVLTENLEEITPIIYTPTVGKACQEYGHIFKRPRGIYISAENRGSMAEILKSWPYQDIRVIVVTDGSRILGLGDLGANGMGIPVGKLSLYTACAGIHPSQTLPVTLDVGTDNKDLIEDLAYVGLNRPRLEGEEYDSFMDEFINAVKLVFPESLLQFEDFSTSNAFNLLEKYRSKICSFNDDIQGTGACALAGVYSALKIIKKDLKDMKFLFLGAGEAGTGIASTIASAMTQEGLSIKEARKNCWFFDINGLVVSSRTDLSEEQLPFAHNHHHISDFISAVKTLKPDAVIGVCGCSGMFTPDVLRTMAEINERPLIFAMSNPTSKAECCAEDAYRFTQGRALFSGGSPFKPVETDGKRFVPGQANNVYIFPGLGMGAALVNAKHVIDEMFFSAARTVASHVTDKELESGCLYPSLSRIRSISEDIAVNVAQIAYARNIAGFPKPNDLREFIKDQIFDPVYDSYV
ncbi:MAG: NAD-dependent malic enzyme [Desulfobacteraceae bacterium]|nr:NAD-dependent malic enzyme [Desulfobacteraceae bacterium]